MTMARSEGKDSPAVARPPGEDLAYYKAQYETLEAELADFQASSKELEAELEKDIEAAEKRERQLQQKAETLGFEVEEWKTKYKQAKTESNNAQNALQKEITSLRESNRTIQLRLRDIEVTNDDMERKARNTTSSLEDLEVKYNSAIEKGVMAEEEIRAGEQEREALRIENQRLRDDLGDLKVEAEIRQDKLRKAEAVIQQRGQQSLSAIADVPRPMSIASPASPATTVSSPTVASPPAKSASSTISDAATPPSPPTSDKSNSTPVPSSTINVPKSRLSMTKPTSTPRAPPPSARSTKTTRTPSFPAASDRNSARGVKRAPMQRPAGLPHSGSLHHLHGLMNKMSMLEQRVQSVRSKLPAPTSTPPRASPRDGSAPANSPIPATVTVRSNRKRTGGSSVSGQATPEPANSRSSSAYSKGTLDRPASRLSFGIPLPTSQLHEASLARPPSRDNLHRPGSRTQTYSTQTLGRPGSRTSLSSRQSLSHLGPSTSAQRPGGRQSLSGTRTPLGGHYSSHSGSVRGGSINAANLGRLSTNKKDLAGLDLDGAESADALTPTPSRRTLHPDFSPLKPTEKTLPPRANGVNGGAGAKRPSLGVNGDMKPPERRAPSRTLHEVGESY